MKYKLTKNNTIIIDTERNIFIPKDSNNPEYKIYLEWLSEGNIPDPEDILPFSPKWKQFLTSLRSTETFTLLRSQARVSIEANALATELRTELGEAASGISTAGNIQPLLDQLSVGITTSQKQEILDLITIYHIPLTIDVGIGTT